MVREHGRMWRTLDALEAALGDESAVDLVRDLREQLAAHNPKEEQILYPRLDEVLTGLAAAELRAMLEMSQTPGDWLCEAMRS